MVALDDAPSPPIGLRIRDRRMKYRALAGFPVELRAADKLKGWIDREAIGGSQPRRIIFEGSSFARSLLVISNGAKPPRLVAKKGTNRPPHNGVAVFLIRTRLGSRSASSSRP